jgi:hypothetical protein
VTIVGVGFSGTPTVMFGTRSATNVRLVKAIVNGIADPTPASFIFRILR